MGKRWIRGVTATNLGVNDSSNGYTKPVRDVALFMFYFMRRVLGWTYIDEGTGAGSTWAWDTSHTQTASDGVLTATDYTFTSAGAAFTVADIGRFLVVVDPTNESNCGIYQILTQPSGTQVTIDFLTTGGNFPVASTGLEYYIIDGDFGVPKAGDWFVIESPHATNPFTMKIEFRNATNAHPAVIGTMSPISGAWDVAGGDWYATAPVMSRKLMWGRGSWNRSNGRFYALGDTDGSFLLAWDHHDSATGNKQGAGYSVLLPLESSPAPGPSELVFQFGCGETNDNANWTRSISNAINDLGQGDIWSERGGADTVSYWMGWRDPSQEFLKRNIVGVNARTGSRDGLPIWIVRNSFRDPERLWAPWGEVPTTHMFLATTTVLGEHQDFDASNYFHIRDNVVIPWPGIPFA